MVVMENSWTDLLLVYLPTTLRWLKFISQGFLEDVASSICVRG